METPKIDILNVFVGLKVHIMRACSYHEVLSPLFVGFAFIRSRQRWSKAHEL